LLVRDSVSNAVIAATLVLMLVMRRVVGRRWQRSYRNGNAALIQLEPGLRAL
jgi:hypothetical protein